MIHEALKIAFRHPDDHPFAVAREVARSQDHEVALCVALLHDAIEDGYSTWEEIAEKVSDEVANGVAALTRQEREPYFDYIRNVRDTSLRIRHIKMCDVRVNLARSTNPSMIKRYQEALEILGRMP